jgi:tryptophanyl-tRNA synthetase
MSSQITNAENIVTKIEDGEDQIINPFFVKASKAGFDYLKQIIQFGTKPITPELIEEIEAATNMRVPTLLRRGIFFSQQDLEQFLEHYKKGETVYVYTGRGPSSESMHLGHLVPFMFTKYLQDAFGCIVVIQMSDDEKYYFKGGNLDDYIRLSRENAKDIIAVGFNPDKTYIFSNFEEIAYGNYGLHRNNVIMGAYTPVNQVRATFGLNSISIGTGDDGLPKASASSASIGMMAWPVYQSTPAYPTSFPFLPPNAFCLVPMACDQAPYFRLARDFAPTQGYAKPACIHSEFLIGLGGRDSKMSSTEEIKPIFLTDTSTEACKKINKCLSGGGDTKELQIKYGADLTTDVPYQWGLIFEDDDDVLRSYAERYSSGEILTGDMKAYMKTFVTRKLESHQAARALVTPDVINLFFNKNRAFDMSRPVREVLELYPKEVYEQQGANFDRYFGCLAKRAERNALLNSVDNSV